MQDKSLGKSTVQLLSDSCFFLVDVVSSEALRVENKLSIDIYLGPYTHSSGRVWLKATSFFSLQYFLSSWRFVLDVSSPTKPCPRPCPHRFIIPPRAVSYTVITMVTSVTSDRSLTDPRATINFCQKIYSCYPSLSVPGLHVGWPC